MQRIYIVRGTSGKYDEQVNWIVGAFTTKEAAEKRIGEATSRAKEILAYALTNKIPLGWAWASMSEKLAGMNEFDPNMDLTSDGATYFMEESYLIA